VAGSRSLCTGPQITGYQPSQKIFHKATNGNVKLVVTLASRRRRVCDISYSTLCYIEFNHTSLHPRKSATCGRGSLCGILFKKEHFEKKLIYSVNDKGM